jgi:hypothetical protein
LVDDPGVVGAVGEEVPAVNNMMAGGARGRSQQHVLDDDVELRGGAEAEVGRDKGRVRGAKVEQAICRIERKT